MTADDHTAQQAGGSSKGVIWLTLFLDLVGFSIVFPVYAELIEFYLQRDGGLLAASMQAIGSLVPSAGPAQVAALLGTILFALFTLAQFLGAPLWGALSDRWGRRPVMLLTIAGNLLAYLLWAVAGSFWLLLISRLGAGFMSGNISVATAAMADITPRRRRSAGMALIGIAFGLGFICGPAIGGLGWELLPRPEPATFAVLQATPFTPVALVAAGLSAINLLWAWRSFGETRTASGTAEQTRTLNPVRCFDPRLGPGVPRINLAYLVFIALFAGMEATLVFAAKEQLGWGPGALGALFVWFGLVSALVQGTIVRRLSGRVSDRRLAITGMLLQAPGYLLLACLPVWPLTAVVMAGTALLTVGMGLCMPALTALVSRCSSEDAQGRALGIFRSAGSIGRSVGPLLGGVLYFTAGAAWPYWMALVLLPVPLLLLRGLDAVEPAIETVPTGAG
ncbi:MAG: MFS transporter [Planctomycetota bacterium]